MFRGRFRVFDKDLNLIEEVENTLVQVGEQSFLKMIAQASVADVSSGGDYYIGFCNPATPAVSDTLASISTEPTSSGGYARIAVTRDATGFPTVGLVNGIYRAQSKIITWTASGADFSAAMSRLFLCNASSGSSGILYAYSGALATPITIVDGTSYSAQYELYLQ